jgi:hypothetical protein
MKKSRIITLGILGIVVLGGGLTITNIAQTRERVIDLSGEGISGIEACPVHGIPFSIERVSAWHGRFSPHATKEWWERVAEAREKYPFAVPFPAQVEDPDIDVVVRSYCKDCRDSFTSYVSSETGEQGGSGQPATRSESDSEGGEEPEPEAEGRSR